jgi:histidine phosphotransferase ChpT
MTVNKIELLELMSARMFHDLAGPVGAIHNSIDFFEEDNQDIREKALNIIKSSSHEAILRLKFFRQAYGNFGDTEIYLNVVNELIQDFLDNRKINLEWKADIDTLESYTAKVILNFIIISLGVIIQEGVLSVECNKDQIKIVMRGEHLIFNDDTKALLEGNLKSTSLSSANIQIYYTYMMMQEAGARLSIDKKEKEIEFIVSGYKG